MDKPLPDHTRHSGTAWRIGSVVHGDNLDLLAAAPDEACDLITIDPPFHTGRTVRRVDPAGPRYSDRFTRGRNGYLAFLRPRFEQMRRVLSRRGTLYVHLDWRSVHYVKVLLDGIFGEPNFLNEIIWSYRTGGRSSRAFPRKHDTILCYAKSAGDHTFHVLREGTYRTDGLRIASDGRPYKSTRNGRIYFHPDGPAITDVWDIPFLSTVSSERTGYPTQKPLALVKRIIQAGSSPGDVVADFFCGSGTALEAAAMLGRRWIGCDQSHDAVRISRARLARRRKAARTEPGRVESQVHPNDMDRNHDSDVAL